MTAFNLEAFLHIHTPFVWLILTSVRSPENFAAGSPFAPPSSFTPDNFVRAFAQGDIPAYILNSAIVTAGACALIVICGMTGAYAIQVLGFAGTGIVHYFIYNMLFHSPPRQPT